MKKQTNAVVKSQNTGVQTQSHGRTQTHTVTETHTYTKRFTTPSGTYTHKVTESHTVSGECTQKPKRGK